MYQKPFSLAIGSMPSHTHFFTPHEVVDFDVLVDCMGNLFFAREYRTEGDDIGHRFRICAAAYGDRFGDISGDRAVSFHERLDREVIARRVIYRLQAAADLQIEAGFAKGFFYHFQGFFEVAGDRISEIEVHSDEAVVEIYHAEIVREFSGEFVFIFYPEALAVDAAAEFIDQELHAGAG